MANANPRLKRKTKARVLIVDDHPIVLFGLSRLINQEKDLVVCGEAKDGPEAMEAIASLNPEIVIVDISLRRANGVELIKNIKARHEGVLVLVVSIHDEALYAERVLRAGAKGYIMKEEATETLITALRQVLAGKIYLSEKMGSKLLQKIAVGKFDTNKSSLSRLSDRELEVFQLLGQGLGTRQIAERLNLSVKTIESYREHIKEKMDLKNASELVRHAIYWVQSKSVG